MNLDKILNHKPKDLYRKSKFEMKLKFFLNLFKKHDYEELAYHEIQQHVLTELASKVDSFLEEFPESDLAKEFVLIFTPDMIEKIKQPYL